MHAMRCDDEDLPGALAQLMDVAGDGPKAQAAYRGVFTRLRARLITYPAPGQTPSGTFEFAAASVRMLAATCLPLAVAVTMHLYPLCALQYVPIPLLSTARFQRAALLRMIRNRSLIVTNAGSERADGLHPSLTATRTADGICVDGTFEYMSLASVADIVFFKAQLADSGDTVLCAADLRRDSVRVGDWKFKGSMRLSDTTPVTLTAHLVPVERYALLPGSAGLRCISDYQRCWFHLFLVDVHLARLDRLHCRWRLPRSAEYVLSLRELAQLRAYALRLLDEYSAESDIEPLVSTTAAMKLRASMLAQSTKAVLQSMAGAGGPDVQQLEEDASELFYIRSQPTADRRILRSLGVSVDEVGIAALAGTHA